MAEVPDIIKSRVRAFLLSCTNHKEPMPTFEMNYGKLYKKLNLRELGFNNLHSFMSAIPDAVSIQREGSVIMLVGIPTEQNKHIVDMIEKQKKTTKKRPIRDSMIFPRFQTGGGRVPSLMMPSFKISYPNSGPRPYRGQPANFYKPAHPPHYSARPVPKHVTPATQSNRFYTPPNRAPKIPSPPKPPTVQKSTTRVSVHDRLGPYNSDDSSSGLEKARRRLEASREAAREKEAQQRETERKAFESAKHRRITATEPLEIRIDGDERSVYLKSSTEGKEARDERQERHKETREPRVIVLKESPNSSDSPMSFDTAVCEVDSDGTSDESYEFPVDADFLRMLVFYVISEADTDRNWVSASGLGSRMRRRLAKAGVETPPAIAESLLKFMQYEWKDMFDACSGKERGDCCHLNTPFQFCSSFRDAFSSKVEPLEPQVQPDNGTLSARIVNVEAPAFYVRLINELSEEMFLGIGEELSNEFLASESSTDVFTYRKNEMCAVSVDIDGARVWRRGRLMSFTLMGDDLDEQTSELTAFVKVFLVDSGEVVNVRAGDVRSLPRRLYSTQGLAYRCVFQGARLEDMGAFDHMLRKYLNKQVELQVHSEQTSDGLMTLQVTLRG